MGGRAGAMEDPIEPGWCPARLSRRLKPAPTTDGEIKCVILYGVSSSTTLKAGKTIAYLTC